MKFFRFCLIFLCAVKWIFLPLKGYSDDGSLNGELVVVGEGNAADGGDDLPLSFRLVLLSITLGVPVCSVAIFSIYHALGYSHCYDEDIGA
jgi:hypothetical protein